MAPQLVVQISYQDRHAQLMPVIRTLAKNERSDHPWQEMTDQELLRSAGLFKHDYQTGNEGYTLAAVLLLGRDEVIQDVIPHHKTDAIVRIQNVDRYDDRDVIRTNLIESYDRLMAFIKKHLPDKFYHIHLVQSRNLLKVIYLKQLFRWKPRKLKRMLRMQHGKMSGASWVIGWVMYYGYRKQFKEIEK